MAQPAIKPETVSEESAAPQQVDWPAQETTRELPAERTKAKGVEDTGYIWDETLPGETQGMPAAAPPRMLATRVTTVSDTILFGSALVGPSESEFQLIPAHRDRLRVTIQVVQGEGEPSVYLGSDRNIAETQSAWLVQTGDILTFDTRDAIYCKTGTGAGSVRIQWAAELVAESANI